MRPSVKTSRYVKLAKSVCRTLSALLHAVPNLSAAEEFGLQSLKTHTHTHTHSERRAAGSQTTAYHLGSDPEYHGRSQPRDLEQAPASVFHLALLSSYPRFSVNTPLPHPKQTISSTKKQIQEQSNFGIACACYATLDKWMPTDGWLFKQGAARS